MNGFGALGLTIATLFFSSNAKGNGGGFQNHVGWTGNFSPRGIDKLEILSEDLEIRFGPAAAEVRVKYQIQNEGRGRKVEIGFPCTYLKLKEDDGTPRLSYFSHPRFELENYTIRKDGQAVKSHEVADDAPVPVPGDPKEMGDSFTRVSSWQVSELDFSKNQTSTVEVSFRAYYSEQGYSVSDDAHYKPTTFSYILSSAAAWKGPIGKGTIRLIVETPFPEEFTIRTPRDRFTKNGNEYLWEFTDLEPTAADDLAIEVYQPFRELGRYGPDYITGGEYIFRGKHSFFSHNLYEASASSQLADQNNFSYAPENVRLWENAWVEGKEGDGIGESLELKVQNPAPLHSIKVTPGYDKGPELWRANNRVAKLKVTLNGEKSFFADLPDHSTPATDTILIPDYIKPVSTVNLEIAGVHRGERFRDTCISRVRLVTELEKEPNVRGAR